MNLFEFADQYPHAPASRDTDTSKAAAEAMKPSAATIQRKIVDALTVRGGTGATSKELADSLGIPYEAVQPRTSELRKLKKIVDSGERRASRAADKKAIVWRLS